VKNEGSDIEILERPTNLDLEGCAGVAFDKAVVNRLIWRLISEGKLAGQPHPNRISMMCKEFEQHKIDNMEVMTKEMPLYLQDPGNVEDAPFTLTYNEEFDTVDVTYEDLNTCFDEVCTPKIEAAIKHVRNRFSYHGVNEKNRESFKVMLVGGFSNFISVKLATERCFSVKSLDGDDRFKMPDTFKKRDKSLAISKGAAILTVKDTHPTCEHSYGFVTITRNDRDQLVENFEPVITKGTRVVDARNCKFSDVVVRARRSSSKIKVYKDAHDGSEPECFTLDNSKGDLFPNTDGLDGLYKIGFSINKRLNRLVLLIHVYYANDDANDNSKRKIREVYELISDKK